MNQLWQACIGHQQTRVQLDQVLKKKTIPHAMLFSGPESVGKRTIARAFASRLLTHQADSEKTALQVRLLQAGNHPDLHILGKDEGKKDLTVESIRELCVAIRLKPYYGNCSVSIIDNAHEMSTAAANALLLSLEEPCSTSYFILVSHAPQRLPATIVSRCQQIHFGELAREEIALVLDSLLPGEEALDGESQRSQLLKLCQGSLAPLELGSVIQPTTLRPVSEKSIREHLLLLTEKIARIRKDVERYMQLVENTDATAAHSLSLASQLAGESDDFPLVFRILQGSIRNQLKHSKSSKANHWADVLLEALQAEKLIRERNLNPQLQLSNLLLETI